MLVKFVTFLSFLCLYTSAYACDFVTIPFQQPPAYVVSYFSLDSDEEEVEALLQEGSGQLQFHANRYCDVFPFGSTISLTFEDHSLIGMTIHYKHHSDIILSIAEKHFGQTTKRPNKDHSASYYYRTRWQHNNQLDIMYVSDRIKGTAKETLIIQPN